MTRPAFVLRGLLAATALALLGSAGAAQPAASRLMTNAALRNPAPAALPVDIPATVEEGRRFLAMASFGASDDGIARLMKIGVGAWIDEQWQVPATSHRAYWEARDAAIRAADPLSTGATTNEVLESFWKHALTGQDQLRQRVAYALSQIFVLSAQDSDVANQPRALADWLDMLNLAGPSQYRAFIEVVARHPLMGRYLTHLRNQKADAASGRVPDENFAREVIQLFSIGVVRLNADGTPMLVNGAPLETYGPADVSGMARVFTGFSFACPAFPANGCFYSGSSNGVSDPDREFKAMRGYPNFHEKGEKKFLGATIAPQATADPDASLRVALDTLATHPNVGPFISKQLIQRLVTSNPSPAYVSAVAAVWADNGAGVRGDIKAVVRAILTHPELLNVSNRDGKLREPVLRLSAYLRAFPHLSDTGRFRVGNTDNPGTQLGQTPLRAPSVFNFYRPGYLAPGSQSAAAGMVAPELQLLNESSVAGWVNFMRDNLTSGVGGYNGTVDGTVYNRRDLQRNWLVEMDWAKKPTGLVYLLAERLLYGQPAETLKNDVIAAVSAITVPTATPTNQTAVNNALRDRVKVAMLLLLASPEFLVQK
ncbi:MAG: DUF1800 family protein [Rubrivivax sp.]